MEKSPNYTVWLHWFITLRCNLDCVYCFVNCKKKKAKLYPVDIGRMMKTLEKTGLVFKIGLTGGGEPFLIPNIVELCSEITKKHTLSINTNLTSSRVRKFIDAVDPSGVEFINASLHIEELLKNNLADRYIENYRLMKEAGFPVKAFAVAHPSLAGKAAEYTDFFRGKGVDMEYTVFIGKYRGKQYPAAYTSDEHRIFGLKQQEWNPYLPGKAKCNAGYNAAIIMPNGNIYPCWNVYARLGNIYKEVKFRDSLLVCPSKKCGCPLNYIDINLYRKALAGCTRMHTPSPLLNFFGEWKIISDYYTNAEHIQSETKNLEKPEDKNE